MSKQDRKMVQIVLEVSSPASFGGVQFGVRWSTYHLFNLSQNATGSEMLDIVRRYRSEVTVDNVNYRIVQVADDGTRYLIALHDKGGVWGKRI